MLGETDLGRALVTERGLWSSVRVVHSTGSTNADLADLARAGAVEGLVLIAESQTAGRGRLGRTWQAPPGTSLTMSVLLRPEAVPAARVGWLPLLAGVAAVRACAGLLPGVVAALKWPNDLLIRPAGGPDGWGKCGGVLAESVDGAVVVGIGINVSQGASDLPPPADPLAFPPTSLSLAGASLDRGRLAVAVLTEMALGYGPWRAARGDARACGLWDEYRDHCATLGRAVTVTLPGGQALVGTAVSIDDDGRLVIATGAGEEHLAAGDVHHVRPDDDRGDPPVQGRASLAPDH